MGKRVNISAEKKRLARINPVLADALWKELRVTANRIKRDNEKAYRNGLTFKLYSTDERMQVAWGELMADPRFRKENWEGHAAVVEEDGEEVGAKVSGNVSEAVVTVDGTKPLSRRDRAVMFDWVFENLGVDSAEDLDVSGLHPKLRKTAKFYWTQVKTDPDQMKAFLADVRKSTARVAEGMGGEDEGTEECLRVIDELERMKAEAELEAGGVAA